MTRYTPLLILALLLSLPFRAQVISIDVDTDQPSLSFRTGKDVLGYLHQTYRNGPCKAYTFSQKNTHYRNDSIVGTSEWQEAIEFPDKFRIDFGDKAGGNYVIFKNDSSYRYKNFELRGKKHDANVLLLLLGGMYYRELPDVIARLQSGGYNTAVLSRQKWNRRKVYVIGAEAGDMSSNQIWVSKKTWRVVRIIERLEGNNMMDMSFDSFQEHCKGYVETKVTFKRNGKTEQVEEYDAIRSVEKFPEDVFNPAPVKK
jgi:hypothetical protein